MKRGSRHLGKIPAITLAQIVQPFAARGLSGSTDEGTDWQRNVGTSKTLARYKGSTISLQAAVHVGHMPRVLMTKKKGRKKCSFIGHCTHAMESADVKVQNIFIIRNNIACSTNCKYRTAATLYTLETWFIAGT
jgi:hypothetical protein